MNPQINHSGHTSVKGWFEFDCVWLFSRFVSDSPNKGNILSEEHKATAVQEWSRTHAGHQQCAVKNRNNRGKIFIVQQTEIYFSHYYSIYCVYYGISTCTSMQNRLRVTTNELIVKGEATRLVSCYSSAERGRGSSSSSSSIPLRDAACTIESGDPCELPVIRRQQNVTPPLQTSSSGLPALSPTERLEIFLCMMLRDSRGWRASVTDIECLKISNSSLLHLLDFST